MDQTQQSLRRLKTGLYLAGHKLLHAEHPITVAPVPSRIVLPLGQHMGEPVLPCVAVGDEVLRGQPVGRVEAYIGTDLHASTSGRVVAIEEHPVSHVGNTTATCLVIEADGRDQPYDGLEPMPDYHVRAPSRVNERVRAAGIVGLGGAVFPTHVKLNVPPDTELKALILNGAECEPYISCDGSLMAARAGEIVAGAQVMMHTMRVNHCLIGIEDERTAAIAAVKEAIDAEGDDRIELREIPAIYPTGGEKQLIWVLTGEEVPERGLPADIGYVCHNVGTAVAVRRAVLEGEPLISRVVTVTGPGVAEAKNLEVRLGTSVADLVALCGGYREGIERLIMGGPMMGVSLATDTVPVVKATNCILALTAEEVRDRDGEVACIRCGECARVCPAYLLPQQLYWHSRARQYERTEDYHLFDCIECGCCDVVCPSHIPLTQYFRNSKAEIWERERRRMRSERSRQRFEQRERRLAKERAEHDARLQDKRSPEAINELLERVKKDAAGEARGDFHGDE